MLKKLWGLLIVMLLLGSVCAYAETDESILTNVKDRLIASFGYTAEEAEGFVIVDKKILSSNEKIQMLKDGFASDLEQEIYQNIYEGSVIDLRLPEASDVTEDLRYVLNSEYWEISVAHADHPEWIYKLDNYTGDNTYVLSSPFISDVYGFPTPEGMLRHVLREAREKGWFTNWTDESKQALYECVERNFDYTDDIMPPMLWEGISAGNAIHELFAAVSNDPLSMCESLCQWRDIELKHYDLELEETSFFDAGNAVYDVLSLRDGYADENDIRVTRFVGEPPEDLQQYLSHPKLEGWKSVCGGVFECDNNYGSPSTINGYGLIAYEKEGERLLIQLTYSLTEKSSSIIPLSTTALYADRPMYILPYISHDWNGWTWHDSACWVIGYQNSPFEYETFYFDSQISRGIRNKVILYKYYDVNTNYGMCIKPAGDWSNSANIRIYSNNQIVLEENIVQSMSDDIRMIDLEVFTSSQCWLDSFPEKVPEGFVLLRQTEYPNGTLAEVMERPIEKDDDWIVQVGREKIQAEAYNIAVNYSMQSDWENGRNLYNERIGYLKVLQDKHLKSEKNEASETLMELPTGTVMFELKDCGMEDGYWMQVAIPQGSDTIGWTMQPSDVIGYIKVNAVFDEETGEYSYDEIVRGNTPLELEWME